MNDAELIDQYIDALNRDPHALPPPGLDAETAAFVRALVESQRSQSKAKDIQDRVWQQALLQAKSEQATDHKSSNQGRIEQKVTFVKPSDRNINLEDNHMHNLSTIPAPRSMRPPRQFSQVILTLAAAVAVIFMVGAALVSMISNGRLPYFAEQTREPLSTAIITSENVTQLKEMGFLGRGNILDMAWSPDGKTLALASVPSGLIWLYNPSDFNAEPRWLAGNYKGTRKILFSADSKLLASLGTYEADIRLWDVATGEERAVFANHFVNTLAYSPDGKLMAGSNPSLKTIWVWDTTTGEDVTAPMKGKQVITDLAFNADGTRLIASGNDGKIQVWDTTTGTQLATLEGHEGMVNNIVFSGSTFASAGNDKTVRLWNWNDTTGGLDVTLQGHNQSVQKVAFSPDGKTLASAGFDHDIYLWDTGTGANTAILSGHTDQIKGIAFSPDSKTLASIGPDQTLRLWDVASGAMVNTVPVIAGQIGTFPLAIFSRDGQSIFSSDESGATLEWDVASRSISRTLPRYASGVDALALTNKLLAYGLTDGTVRLRDVKTGEDQITFEAISGGNVFAIAITSNGSLVASGGKFKSARLWDVASGQESITLEAPAGDIFAMAFSPDGKTLAAAGADNTLHVWDATTGKIRMNLTPGTTGLNFSPDGTLIAGGGDNGDIYLWDATSGQERAFLAGGPNLITATVTAFSPDGKLLVTGLQDVPSDSDNAQVRVWDVATGKELFSVSDHTLEIDSISFSPDGRLIVFASLNGTIRLWGIPDSP